MNALPHFPRKWFQLSYSKICKNLKNALFKRLQNSFMSSRLLQNHFLWSFSWPNFDLNSFERFASLSQKTVSTSPLKNLKKTEKCPFQTLKTFDFELIVASKRFPEKVPPTKAWFKNYWTLFLISTLPFKNLQKSEKWDFQRFTTFGFDLKVAAKPFSKTLTVNNFEFKMFWFFASLDRWKICEKVKNAILKRSGDWVASKVSF